MQAFVYLDRKNVHLESVSSKSLDHARTAGCVLKISYFFDQIQKMAKWCPNRPVRLSRKATGRTRR